MEITAQAIRITVKLLRGCLLFAVVLLAVLLGGIRLFGLTPYTVLSGSMEPTYPVGSVIYVAKAEPESLSVGDPLTYRLPEGTLVTHRIREVLNENSEELAFLTKGDANDHPDGSPVPAAAVVGKPLFHIPFLGYLSTALQTPKSVILLVSVGAVVLAISFAVDAILEKGNQSPPSSDSEPEEE